MTWTDDVARFVLDVDACPRCHTRTWGGLPALRDGVCARCGADVREAGAELWEASQELVAAARRRQAIVDALPTAVAAAASASPVATAAAAAPPAVAGAAPVAKPVERPRSAVSLQSVLAVVGAGLLAVAAIVFTFLNPDLTDFSTRTTIIGVVTAVFLGGAWLLHSRRLQFSAEAVGALGMVFLALDVWAFSRVAPDGLSAWFFGALGLAVSGAVMVAVGAWLRMRTWLWSGLVGLALVPALVGYGFDELRVFSPADVATAWGHVAVLLVGWGLIELTRPLGRRMASPLRADRVAITVLQLLAILLTLVIAATWMFRGDDLRLASAAVLGALAVGALLSTRGVAPVLWSIVSGLLVSGALVQLALTVPVRDGWQPVSLAVAVTLPVVATAVIRRMGSINRSALLVTQLIVAAFLALPAIVLILAYGATALALTWMSRREPWVVEPVTAEGALVAVISLGVIATGVWAASRGVRTPAAAGLLAATARWVLVPAAAGLPLVAPAHVAAVVAISLGLSAASSLALLFVPRVRDSRLTLRAPIAMVAYGGVVEAIGFSWPHAELAGVAGALAVGAIALAARSASPRIRPLHTGLGFGYAIIAGAAALSLTELGTLPVLCLLTSGAALVAIAASVTSWLPVGSWYAVLGVTAVPFGIGVFSVLTERSGWTALSTGVILLLAVTLLLTRRTGAGLLLRAGAAALIVPTLAVVVVCLTAQLLTVSGSPYALVIIAVLVACALPTTGLVRAGLLRYGMPEPIADAVRLAIEASSLVTGAIAVVLALVRAAAGLEIAFVVLLVLGIGAAATALWMRRRYGWWTAAASWTGALWCAWALAGVTVVEPYLLPPALAAITVGTILLARRRTAAPRSAAALVATGLGIAVVPSLALLAITGNGTGTSFEAASELWRAYALLAGGVVLVVLAALVTRPAGVVPTRFESIRPALLLAAVVAGAAGTVQGVRLAWEVDALPIADMHQMAQVFGFAILGAGIAGAAGVLAVTAGTRSRWVFAPALLFLAIGPMAAIRNDPAAIWTLWGLELALLLAMIATVWRAREGAVHLPPVWFQWALAWTVAVTAWSQREILRVEGFSIPLGIALVIVGAIAFARGRRDSEPRTLHTWPIGFSGSWATLAPGIIATLLPSVMATFTDPQTWRAILVIAFALIAVLVGARKTLAAPFILGISALPLEILVVFLVQLGDTINPLLWWITLATAGIVLLVIAVGWERRTGADASLAARIRDLR
ncbi:hypothetical protein H4J02_08075 [Protaetiibacter sp. SSC-01]|uniref:SCO7613 C-terminal domain-containing membrane protein n=1 Tax=Protaetiibacter sp. SSC-01 TaxID=2759943 RepID=UPI001656EA08|nr:hypothetical protein [Protaetiibacter sp. SSC-01]QNO36487.1 hypothetical protein H4J02_08075 [Protaetiibacter sp. SSC-01]